MNTRELNAQVDEALLGLIIKLVENSRYEEASLVVNRLTTSENVKKALDILGFKLNVSKLKESVARKCLASLMEDKIPLGQQIQTTEQF